MLQLPALTVQAVQFELHAEQLEPLKKAPFLQAVQILGSSALHTVHLGPHTVQVLVDAIKTNPVLHPEHEVVDVHDVHPGGQRPTTPSLIIVLVPSLELESRFDGGSSLCRTMTFPL